MTTLQDLIGLRFIAYSIANNQRASPLCQGYVRGAFEAGGRAYLVVELVGGGSDTPAGWQLVPFERVLAEMWELHVARAEVAA